MLYRLHVSTGLIDGAKTYHFYVLDLYIPRVILVAAGTVSTLTGCYVSCW